MGKDVKDAFKKLAETGYKNIETATYTDDTYYSYRPKELKAIIDDLGMKYFFYEQDTAKSMDDVILSYNSLKKILGTI